MVIRETAVILALSVSMGVAAPAICELICSSRQNSQAQVCHDQRQGTRVLAANAACDHRVADVTILASTSKVDLLKTVVVAGLARTRLYLEAMPPRDVYANSPRRHAFSLGTVSNPVLRI